MNHRVTTREPQLPHTQTRTRWTILDPATRQCCLVSHDECFPIAGRLLSGVWQLDDGRVLMAMSVGPVDETQGQPTVRVEYLDRDAPVVAPPASQLRLVPELPK